MDFACIIFEVYKPHDTIAKPTDKACRQMQRIKFRIYHLTQYA